MIFKKYGTSYHSVNPNFDSRAMTEVGFQKSGDQSVRVEDFEAQYELTERRELIATAEGSVQDHVEKEMLESLRKQLADLDEAIGADEVLVIENEQGKDYPKTREKQTTQVVGNENKLYFQRSIDPPLRIAVYRQRKS